MQRFALSLTAIALLFVAAGCSGYIRADAIKPSWDAIAPEYQVYLDNDESLSPAERKLYIQEVEIITTILEEATGMVTAPPTPAPAPVPSSLIAMCLLAADPCNDVSDQNLPAARTSENSTMDNVDFDIDCADWDLCLEDNISGRSQAFWYATECEDEDAASVFSTLYRIDSAAFGEEHPTFTLQELDNDVMDVDVKVWFEGTQDHEGNICPGACWGFLQWQWFTFKIYEDYSSWRIKFKNHTTVLVPTEEWSDWSTCDRSESMGVAWKLNEHPKPCLPQEENNKYNYCEYTLNSIDVADALFTRVQDLPGWSDCDDYEIVEIQFAGLAAIHDVSGTDPWLKSAFGIETNAEVKWTEE